MVGRKDVLGKAMRGGIILGYGGGMKRQGGYFVMDWRSGWQRRWTRWRKQRGKDDQM